MFKVSIIISISDDENCIACLDSILNQTLNNIEIICSYTDKNYSIFEKYSKKEKRVKLIPLNRLSLSDIHGEYVIQINNMIPNEICEKLYNMSKKLDLDILYIPNHDCFIEDNYIDENFIITPINFSIFYKKELFNKKINAVNSKYKFDFFDESLYFQNYLNCFDIGKEISKILLEQNDSKSNYLFSILIKYLNNLPINRRQYTYDLIKENFKNIELTDKNRMEWDIILKNKYYLDFFTELKLMTTDYEIYGNQVDDSNYKISVIIPIYNNEKLIHRTLMSIENQSFNLNHIEVLMINDASTDNTFNIINEYVDKYPNFTAIHIKNGSGSAGTPRNIGLKLASADYVIFLDHDDFFEIDALTKLYSNMIKYDCDIVYGTYVLIDNDTPRKFYYPRVKQGFFDSLNDNKKLIALPPSIWTKLFNKKFLLKNNILFPPILGEDAIFMSKSLNEANGICYLANDVICYYNLNETSYTNRSPYNYFVEGFASEEYLFNLYGGWSHKEYYCLRGRGILDYYINRFMESDLSDNEIGELFPLFYEFCYRLYLLGICPQTEKNNDIFNYIIKQDLDSLIKIKNHKPNKIKVISDIVLNKINKYLFW